MYKYPSPLRYPGGKGKLANFIKLVILNNDLVSNEYVEVYAGGSSIALSLLFDQYVSRVHINDFDRSIFSFWHSVLYETENLCRLIFDTDITMDNWYKQKAVQKDSDIDTLLLGFSTFYLNRTNRSGIIKGGVIGGKNQSGKWKMNVRFNKRKLIARIERVARYKDYIKVTNLDAIKCILSLDMRSDKFLYLDPPYYKKGKGLYCNYYLHSDHEELAKFIPSIRHSWMLSYDADPVIVDMYKQYEPTFYGLDYSVQERYTGTEVLYLSPSLKLPYVESPVKVDKIHVANIRRSYNTFV